MLLQITNVLKPDDPAPGECIENHQSAELALNVFILAGMVISYVPQHLRIIRKGTSEGISPWFLLLGCVSATSTFFNIIILQWRIIQCCKVIRLGPCLESMLGIAQLGAQFVMFSLVFVLYLIYYPPYKKVNEAIHNLNLSCLPATSMEWALSVFIAKVVLGHFVLCLTFTTFLLSVVGGPENPWTSSWAGFLGILSATLATIQYLPQIYRTYRRKSVGALSIPMMLMQTPGAALVTLSLILRPGANWTTWIVYAVTGTLQGVLLCLCIYYYFRARNLGFDAFDNAETEPLLRAGAHNPHPHTGPSHPHPPSNNAIVDRS
ncbi:hypothetical protein DFQ26_009759 [Actinomortierella ambigua]|nr:hypothetical protein DFQ26_009759 [Actinomortierella ambigua]